MPGNASVCGVCGRLFKSRQFLSRHLTVHSDLREFACDICGKSYKYKKGVNRHRQLVHKVPKMTQSLKAKSVHWSAFLAGEADYKQRTELYDEAKIFDTPPYPNHV